MYTPEFLVYPSEVSFNTRQLSRQPELNIESYLGVPMPDSIVLVRTVPAAKSVSGGSVTSSGGVAKFIDLQVAGVPGTSYQLCFYSYNGYFTETCTTLSIVNCSDIKAHSTLENEDCSCDKGYQPTLAQLCEACPLHMFKADVGQSGCTRCPDYSFTMHNASTGLSDCVCMQSRGFVTSKTGGCVCNIVCVACCAL